MSTGWLDLSGGSVQEEQARRQVAVARTIAGRFESQPGIILADEVGMGKTFTTFGVIALGLDAKRRGYRALVLVPNRDLVTKWAIDLGEFTAKEAIAGREGGNVARRLGRPTIATTTAAVLESRRPVTIATMSSVAGGVGKLSHHERAFLFEAAVSRPGVTEARRRRLGRRYGFTLADRAAAREKGYLGIQVGEAREVAQQWLWPVMVALDDRRAFNEAVRQARTYLVRDRLRRYDLLVIDEAHQLRSPGTLRYRSLDELLKGRAKNVLFLTATPFQLDVEELRAVFALLQRGTGRGGHRFTADCGEALRLARLYQEALARLAIAWRSCSDAEACAPDADVVALGAEGRHLRAIHERAVEAKGELELVLRRLMIRGTKDKRYRRQREGSLVPDLPAGQAARVGVQVSGGGRAAYAASVALLHEHRAGGERTFGPVQLQSLTSSYEAFFEGHLGRNEELSPDAEWYRDLLRELTETAPHPKVDEVVKDAVRAALEGRKTVIFTGRLETARLLAERIERELGVRGPAGTRAAATLRSAFWDRRSPTSLLLRDNLIHTYLPQVVDADALAAALTFSSLEPTIVQAPGRSRRGVGRARRDVLAIATAVEVAVLDELERSGGLDEEAAATAREVASGDDGAGPRSGDRASTATGFDVRGLHRLLTETSGIWSDHASQLEALTPEVRHAAVRAVRSQIMAEHNGLLDQLVSSEGDGDRSRHLAVERRLRDAVLGGEPLRDRIDRFLALLAGLRDDSSALNYAEAAESTRSLVTRLTGEQSADARDIHRHAFNTPFPPWVAVATGVAEVGVDLHRECARVIHHDLEWNPATMEQRVGRVDRIGSMVERELETDTAAELFVGAPYIRGTIDERMWKRSQERRKWIGVFLGERVTVDDEDLDVDILPVPEDMTRPLRMDLEVPGW